MDVREFNPRVEASGEHPHACTGGFVFVGYIDEDGEEAIEALPCRRCAERSTMTKELAQELVGLFDLTGWHDMQESLYADLESRSAEEMEEEFGRVADLLRGLAYTAESSLGLAGVLILGEAQKTAEMALYFCETYGKEVVDKTG